MIKTGGARQRSPAPRLGLCLSDCGKHGSVAVLLLILVLVAVLVVIRVGGFQPFEERSRRLLRCIETWVSATLVVVIIGQEVLLLSPILIVEHLQRVGESRLGAG